MRKAMMEGAEVRMFDGTHHEFRLWMRRRRKAAEKNGHVLQYIAVSMGAVEDHGRMLVCIREA